MKKITKLILELRKYTTEKGNQLLDQLIEEFLKGLEEISRYFESGRINE